MMKNQLPEDPTGLSDAVDENDLKRVLDAGLVIESTFEADFLSRNYRRFGFTFFLYDLRNNPADLDCCFFYK